MCRGLDLLGGRGQLDQLLERPRFFSKLRETKAAGRPCESMSQILKLNIVAGGQCNGHGLTIMQSAGTETLTQSDHSGAEALLWR